MLTASCEDSSEGFNYSESDDEVDLNLAKQSYNERIYSNMMSSFKNNIDDILLESKPNNISLPEYKIKLINGETELTNSQENRIMNNSKELQNYALHLANTQNIDIDTSKKSSLLALGGLYSPNDDLDVIYPIDNDNPGNIYQTNGDLTWGEIGTCAAVAVGADLIWSLGAETGVTSWAVPQLTRAFSRVAGRFLGPIGVAIAVASFGVCIAEAAGD